MLTVEAFNADVLKFTCELYQPMVHLSVCVILSFMSLWPCLSSSSEVSNILLLTYASRHLHSPRHTHFSPSLSTSSSSASASYAFPSPFLVPLKIKEKTHSPPNKRNIQKQLQRCNSTFPLPPFLLSLSLSLSLSRFLPRFLAHTHRETHSCLGEVFALSLLLKSELFILTK